MTVSLSIDRYANAPTRHDKTLEVTKIIDTVHQSGGRFIKWENGGWVELNEKQRKEKVGHALRDMIQARERVKGTTSATEAVRTGAKSIFKPFAKTAKARNPAGLVSVPPRLLRMETAPVPAPQSESRPPSWRRRSLRLSSIFGGPSENSAIGDVELIDGLIRDWENDESEPTFGCQPPSFERSQTSPF